MNIQNTIVYVLVGGAVVFLLIKYLKPAFSGKKKDNCDTNCNCK